jgi:hypothetical protein
MNEYRSILTWLKDGDFTVERGGMKPVKPMKGRYGKVELFPLGALPKTDLFEEI